MTDGIYNYTYDVEGNRISRTEISTGDVVEYSWDLNNQLTAVVHKTSADVITKTVEYDYDAFGRRIGKRVDDDGDGAFDRAERYVYDDAKGSLNDIVLVYDDSGSLTNRYLHGPTVDQIFADENVADDILWALADNQGTVRDIVDYDDVTDTTSVVKHRQYDSFGNITSDSDSSVDFLYSYTGREWDADAELYYYRARWYDPVAGRFTSEDPIGFAAGDTNLQRYVGNSTTNFVDPSGKRRNGYFQMKEITDNLYTAAAKIFSFLDGSPATAVQKHRVHDNFLRSGVAGGTLCVPRLLADVLFYFND